MKARLLKSCISYAAVLLLFPPSVGGEPDASGKVRSIRRSEALMIAERTEEARLFYELRDGTLRNCVEKSVLRPCDTDWVTCVEDAWAVEFRVGESCPVSHDGRLTIRLLIDGVEGKILSRYPEAEYFRDPSYCLEDYECAPVEKDGEPVCLNFIHAQIADDTLSVEDQGSCRCEQNICR